MENALVEISLQSYKNCKCDGGQVDGPYFGPWRISISKNFIRNVMKDNEAWRKKVKLRGPQWPPDEMYKVKTSSKNRCLREGVDKKKLSEVLQYIMDTNTDKFHSESPITVRLAWFMEKQMKNTYLVNSVYDWDTEEVIRWLYTAIGLPQYQDCFEVNGIRGRHLPLLDAERLEQMGIRDFDHILKITSEIRKMFKTQREKSIWREVTEARYDPLTLHAMYNYRKVSKRLPVHDFYIDGHFINRKIPHYSMFELKRPVWDIFPRNIRTAHRNLYFEQRHNDEYPKEHKLYTVDARW